MTDYADYSSAAAFGFGLHEDIFEPPHHAENETHPAAPLFYAGDLAILLPQIPVYNEEQGMVIRPTLDLAAEYDRDSVKESESFSTVKKVYVLQRGSPFYLHEAREFI